MSRATNSQQTFSLVSELDQLQGVVEMVGQVTSLASTPSETKKKGRERKGREGKKDMKRKEEERQEKNI